MSDNFWGTAATEATGEFDSGGGSFELIPEGTNVLAAISEIEWTLYNGDEYISAKWTVLKPDEFKNRKIFQKIRVMDEDVKKADKAKRMLAAIDKNASGGKLLSLDRQPTDSDMAKALVNKPRVLKLGVWEMNDKSGNWIVAISPKTAQPSSTKPKPAPANVDADFDNDVPW